MRVPKTKGIIRHYFQPLPSMPSSTSPLCLHTNPDASLSVYMDISIFHQFLRAPINRHQYAHPQQNPSCEPKGVLKQTLSFHPRPPAGPSPLMSPSRHYSLSPPGIISSFYSFLSLLLPSLLSNTRISRG